MHTFLRSPTRWLVLTLLAASGCSSSHGDGTGGSKPTGPSASSAGPGSSTSASTGTGGETASSGATTSSGVSTSSAASTGSTSSGSSSGTAPVISGCQIFPADNPWNTRIDDTTAYPVHPDWANYQTTMSLSTHLHPDWGDFNPDGYGIPYNVVPATQAYQDTTFTLYASESDPGPGGWVGPNPVTSMAAMGTARWPFFKGMEIEGNPPACSGSACGVPGCLPGDQHGLVLQQGASGCTLFEAWNCVYPTTAPFECANGAVFDLTSNTLRTDGWTSADAAGLPIFPGLVKLSEVMAGAVNHAIRFTMSSTQQAYIHPATHAAGGSNTSLPPMGLRLRLKASFDTSKFTGPSLVIMTAMKQYGLMLADNGSDWFFGGDSNDNWTPLMCQLLSDFDMVHGSDFEAVYTGPNLTTGL